MKDTDCVRFLQWVLPRMHMRWPGFRKVRGQVCKRLSARIRTLKLDDISAYVGYLDSHPEEWRILDKLCRVTISRFYREKAVFQFLQQQVIPALVRELTANGENRFNVLSLGSASGEEPYTIAILWQLQFRQRYPDVLLNVVATDADSTLIERSAQACYPYSSIKNLPEGWRKQAFVEQADLYCLRPAFRRDVRFLQQDIREAVPAGPFDLILCRNLPFTYFDENVQQQTLERINGVLKSGGALVIGIHESLPVNAAGLAAWSEKLRIFSKQAR
jgi:chemotaxis protein methyltransferase CheR